jgi:hypothetical protein
MSSGWGYGASPLELLACQAMVAGLVYLDEFTYSTSWIAGTSSALTASGDVTRPIQINSDSDFIAQEYNLTTTGSTADFVGGLGDFLIQITRAGSGRNIMDNPQRVLNFCGNYAFTGSKFDPANGIGANQPGRLTISSLYQGNSTVQIRLVNLSPTFNPVRVDFAMKGFKCFYQTNASGQTGNRQQIFHAL